MLIFFKTILQKLVEYGSILLEKETLEDIKVKQPFNEEIIFSNLDSPQYLLSEEKVGRIMCKASEVGKIVVNKCLDQNFAVNTQKLQKLLVLMQIECIRRSGRPLFKEDIRIWSCGVAIKEVDDEFYGYAEGFTQKLEEFITLLDAEEASVDCILNKYGQLDAFELNQLPDNQKVKDLGVIGDNSLIPHISHQILTGAFDNDANTVC